MCFYPLIVSILSGTEEQLIINCKFNLQKLIIIILYVLIFDQAKFIKIEIAYSIEKNNYPLL